MDLILHANVNALGGFIKKQHRGSLRYGTSQQNLLLVSTRQGFHRRRNVATINKTQEDVDLIKSANIRFIEAPTGRSKQIADGEFHQSIFKAAASPALTDTVLLLEKRVSLSAPEHPWGGANVHEDLEARAATDHSRPVELIEKGDANTASSVAERHVLLDLEVIHRARIAAEIRPVKAD